ncbi:hypothetical protein PSHT_14974, partial [Puccinia striiformis]
KANNLSPTYAPMPIYRVIWQKDIVRFGWLGAPTAHNFYNGNIRQQWNWIISNCCPTWEKLVIGQSVFMEFENQDELLEEELLEQEERQVFHPLQIDLTI